MNFSMKILSAEQWNTLSEKAHLVTFGEIRPASKERIDFALIAVDPDETLLGYVTMHELDSETIYWQFGGAFPSMKGTIHTFACYKSALKWCQGKYKRVSTLIKNDNVTMLKFALKAGFRVTGLKYFNGNVLLEHTINLQGE